MAETEGPTLAKAKSLNELMSEPMQTLPHYILQGKTPVRVKRWTTWLAWMRRSGHLLWRDEKGKVAVSTVFLWLPHINLAGKPGPFFETMIFGGKHGSKYDRYQERCQTYNEARRQHQAACLLAKVPFSGKRISAKKICLPDQQG